MNKQTNGSRQHILNVATEIISCKGFSAVGLNEILKAAEVPKGSFYHYFASKEAFGVDMLQAYFEQYLIDLNAILEQPTTDKLDSFMHYWRHWLDTQGSHESCGTRCLVVKLAAEVSDLSEAMRDVLQEGTRKIIRRLADALVDASEEGHLMLTEETSATLAETLYQLWLGASLMVKISQTETPLQQALAFTEETLTAYKA